jgi:hypothetical protein
MKHRSPEEMVRIRKLMYGLEAIGVAYIVTDEEGFQADTFTVGYERRPTMAEFRDVVTATTNYTPPDWTEFYDEFFEGADFLEEEIL